MAVVVSGDSRWSSMSCSVGMLALLIFAPIPITENWFLSVATDSTRMPAILLWFNITSLGHLISKFKVGLIDFKASETASAEASEISPDGGEERFSVSFFSREVTYDNVKLPVPDHHFRLRWPRPLVWDSAIITAG